MVHWFGLVLQQPILAETYCVNEKRHFIIADSIVDDIAMEMWNSSRILHCRQHEQRSFNIYIGKYLMKNVHLIQKQRLQQRNYAQVKKESDWIF